MRLPGSSPAGNIALTLIIPAALLLLSSSGAFAATLFSNLGQTSSGTAAGIAIPGQLVATEFVTGGSASSVTGLAIRIQNNDNIQHSYSAHLYADSAGAPQANGLLATFTPVSATLTASQTALATFSHAGLALGANTRYWLALGIGENSSLSSSAFVETASNAADVGSIFSNASPPNMFNSPNSGGFWTDTITAQNGQFSLEGSLVVPEPSRMMLTLLGLFMLFFRRRHML